MRLKPLKIDEIDDFLSKLAAEFEVPKPNYCIYKIVTVKRLEPFKEKNISARITGVRAHDIFGFGAAFIPYSGKLCYIVLLLEGTKGISRKNLIHEFFHYLHYVKRGYKPLPNKEAIEKEEKEVRRETEKYLRKMKDEKM